MKKLGRKKYVIWLTGMSGAGKTTLAKKLFAELLVLNIKVKLLDGDIIRKEINPQLNFTHEDIIKNNYKIIELTNKLLKQYNVVIVAVIAPFKISRQHARNILSPYYFEVYVKASLDILINRDTKGLYNKALNDKIDNLIGFSKKLPYEEPTSPDLVINTDNENINSSSSKILEKILSI